MKPKPDIYWTFESDTPSSLTIQASANGLTLSSTVSAQYPDPIQAAVVVEQIRDLETLLVEVLALRDRLKELG